MGERLNRTGLSLPFVAAVLGAAFLAASAAIHLDLYLTGYRSIPTIGWMFLLQVITGFVLAAGLLISRGRLRRLVAGAGAGFSLSTLGGYLLSVWTGLFGFKEVHTTSGLIAGILEVAATAVLCALAIFPTVGPNPTTELARVREAGRRHPPALRVPLAVALVSVGAAALLGVAVAVASGPTSSSADRLETRSIGGITVLTNARGRTLYWFAPDTATKSVCYGTCAAYWPPATGAAVAGPGVTGKVGVIERSDGSTQTTYEGHPLYTYIADTAPGQANGNGINLNGGLWWEVTPSGRFRP